MVRFEATTYTFPCHTTIKVVSDAINNIWQTLWSNNNKFQCWYTKSKLSSLFLFHTYINQGTNHTLMKTCAEKSSTNNSFNYGQIKWDLEFFLFGSLTCWIRGITLICFTWLNINKKFCWLIMYEKYLWTRRKYEVELLTRRLVKEKSKWDLIIMLTRVTKCPTM